jgi:hypothetical protein
MLVSSDLHVYSYRAVLIGSLQAACRAIKKSPLQAPWSQLTGNRNLAATRLETQNMYDGKYYSSRFPDLSPMRKLEIWCKIYFVGH